jgi:hypothetical protein
MASEALSRDELLERAGTCETLSAGGSDDEFSEAAEATDSEGEDADVETAEAAEPADEVGRSLAELERKLAEMEKETDAQSGGEEESLMASAMAAVALMSDGLKAASTSLSEWAWPEACPIIDVAKTHQQGVVVVKIPQTGQAHFTCPRSLPHPDLWPYRPLLLRESSVHMGWSADSTAPPLPIDGRSVPVETALVKGHMCFRIRGVGGAVVAKYFEGRNRLSSFVVSGRFKQALAFEDVQTGQEFCHPVKQPSSFLSAAIVRFFKLIAPLLRVQVGEQTFMFSPLMQAAQIVHVGDAPYELGPSANPEENFAAVELGKPSMTAVQRRKHFGSYSNLKGQAFRTDKYYTFDFYNDKLDLETFSLHVLGQTFKVQEYLRGQPLRMLSRVLRPGPAKDLYLWNFELWNDSVVMHLADEIADCCK